MSNILWSFSGAIAWYRFSLVAAQQLQRCGNPMLWRARVQTREESNAGCGEYRGMRSPWRVLRRPRLHVPAPFSRGEEGRARSPRTGTLNHRAARLLHRGLCSQAWPFPLV